MKNEPIRCCRCGVEIKDRHDDTARVRLGLLFGPRLSVLWKQDAPWKYLDLCIGCGRAFDEWVEAGPGIPRPSRPPSPAASEAPLARRLKDKVNGRVKAKASVPAEGAWLYPLDSEPNGG